MMKKYGIAILLGALTLSACQLPNTQTQTGTLKIRVAFPERKFDTQLIKPETRAIYVAVYQGEIQNNPLIFGPITPQNPTVSLKQVDSGRHRVVASAYASQGEILTAGQQSAFVRANHSIRLDLELLEDWGSDLSPEEARYMRELKINIPSEDQALPSVLTPIPSTASSQRITPSTRAEDTAPQDLDIPQIEATPSSTPEATPEPTPEPTPTATPIPTPTPRPYYSGGGGGGGGGGFAPPPAAPAPSSPEPSSSASGANPEITVVDGDDQLDPIDVVPGGGS